MSTVSPPQVVAPEDGQATELPHRVQEALGLGGNPSPAQGVVVAVEHVADRGAVLAEPRIPQRPWAA